MATKRASRAEYQRQRRAAMKSEPGEPVPITRAAEIEQEMRRSFETAKARLESGLKDLLPGSNAHVKLVTEIADLERDYREERASRGLDPARLGAAGPTGYHFVCHVGPGGSVSTVQVQADKLEQVLATERKRNEDMLAKVNTPERAAEEAALNAEYGFDADGNDHSYDGAVKEAEPHDAN